MSEIRQTVSAPAVAFDEDSIANALGNFLQAQGITTQAGWVTFVNALTIGGDANFGTIMKGFLRSSVRVTP